MKIRCFLIISLSLFFFNNVNAQLRLAKLFSDNMVFQCDTPVSIWGWADKNAPITIVFNKNKFPTKSDENGFWKKQIPVMPVGGPYDIKITSGENSISLSNVMFGDVWLCGGQSNMEWYVENSKNAEEEIKNAKHPNIRLFDVPHRLATHPEKDFENGEWRVCSPETVAQFSGVGYFFGRDLEKELNKPIGLINNNYGGTVVEAWTSSESLIDMPVYKKQIDHFNAIIDLEKAKNDGETEQASWMAAFNSMDKGISENKYIWAEPEFNCDNWEETKLPGVWESSGIKSMKDLDGVVWYIKEFELPEFSENIKAALSLGAIDDSDKTWINGKLVGETHNQYNKNRVYKISDGILNPGKNRVVIRVEDYVGNGGLSNTADMVFLKMGEQKIPLAGIWKYKVGMVPKTPFDANNFFGPNTFPTCLYNGMIAPMVDFPIKGVIWYQGETNSYRAYEYRDLFKRWINDWRKQWGNKNLPVLFVQLANFTNENKVPKESIWAELREAQAMALELPHTAMISAIDIGEAKSIHPINKQEVGRRLSLAALNEVYGKKEIKYKGASFSRMEKNGKYIDLFFNDTYDGLKVTDKFSYVFGFSIAGKDKIFHWSKAEIIAPNQIRVWADNISAPEAVRYSWQDNPKPANVFNSEGFPLLPFRTDDWELSTFGINRE